MNIESTTAVVAQDDAVDLDRLGDEIAELSAHLDAATAHLLTLIREFDARAGWNTGFRSCAAWLSWRVGLDLGAARERVRVARALGTLPLLAQALARGELSYAKARALTRVATPETDERLLAVGRQGTAAHVERIVRGWRKVDRLAEAREAKQRHISRAVHVYQDDDGMVIVRGRLEPEVGALFMQALAAARETLYERARGEEASALADPIADPPTMAQQQADALALLAESALHQTLDPGAPGERYQVVVHVDATVLADPDQPGQSVLEDGVRVSAEPSMWLSPLPVALKRHMLRAWRGQRSVTLLVPTEPDAEPDPGRFEVPRRVDTACAVITYQETLPRQTPCPLRKGGGDGRGECAMCRPRCAQDDGGGLRASTGRAAWGTAEGDEDFCDHVAGVAGAARVADRPRRDPSGDGIHGGVLAARVCSARRRRDAGAGQRAAREDGAGPQDRCAGL